MAGGSTSRGVQHAYSYDGARRLLLDAETGTIPSTVESSIKSIAYGYDSLGQRNSITSYANNNGTGTIRNQVVFTFEVNGGIQTEFQAHDGGINWTTTPTVWHQRDGFASSGVLVNGLRMARLHYPNGAYVDFQVGGSVFTNPDTLADRLNQTTAVSFTPAGGSAQQVAAYQYNGTRRTVETDYTVPDVRRRMFALDSAGANDYNAWDRFGRTGIHAWHQYGGGFYLDRFDYTYDYAGNRLTRDIPSSLYTANNRDQQYGYDGLLRLAAMNEGTLSGAAITGTPSREEDWSLDALGNWGQYTQNASTSSLDYHNFTTNAANEITQIDSYDVQWEQAVYDQSGNMTGMPAPLDVGTLAQLTYDAWNRLVSYDAGTELHFEYDGLNRRIVKTTPYETRHYYYNSDWQVVEERLEVGGVIDPDPVNQYIWHPEYVDALAMRRYNANVDGDVTDAREGDYYYLQDANYNVTAITNASGAVVERYAYTPYGRPTILNGASDFDSSVSDWSVDSSQAGSDIGNVYLYTG